MHHSNPKSRITTSLLVLAAVAAFSPRQAVADVLTGVAVTPANPTIEADETRTFSAIGSFSDGASEHLLGSPVVALSAGQDHTCAVLANGGVQCWGYSAYGQLGNGGYVDSATPVAVSGISTATSVAVGADHSCASLVEGTVRCWGYNGIGQLGNGNTKSTAVPVITSGISNAIAVEAGDDHTCALLADGKIRCWGNNIHGQLGNGQMTTTPATTAVDVVGITTATMLALGETHSCALLAAGSVKCWGRNASGELGDGTATSSAIPVTVSGLSTATALAVGHGNAYDVDHSCALLASGAVQCWGHNNEGQLGDGTTTLSRVPVTVSGIGAATAVVGGNQHTCVTLTGGTMKCWGLNVFGELGNGTTTSSLAPVDVVGITNAIMPAAASFHNCVLLDDGEVRCWGYNYFGQLGDGTTELSTTPVSVVGTPAVTVEWTSSDVTVASIDEAGVAHAVDTGSTLITATAQGIVGSTNLTVTETIPDMADLAVRLTDAPDPVARNGRLVYTLTVTNKGPGTARRVRLNNTPPAGVAIDSIQTKKGNCGFWGGSVKCWLGNLASGQSTTIVVNARPQVGGVWIVDHANTWSDTPDSRTWNNKAQTGTWVRR